MRFVKLTEAELKTLKEGHKRGSQFQFRNRCFCLILSSHGKSVQELTQFFEVSRITIYSWLDAWEASGIVGLIRYKFYCQASSGIRNLHKCIQTLT
jgi:transposase